MSGQAGEAGSSEGAQETGAARDAGPAEEVGHD
jgi:hypothetical protein